MEKILWRMLAVCLAEFLGTFSYIYVGCMATVLYEHFPHIVGFIWGLAILTGSQICWHVSGGHLNPCVSIAAVIMGNIPYYYLPIYFIAQLLGTLVGFATTIGMIPESVKLEYEQLESGNIKSGICMTSLKYSSTHGIILEFLITATVIFCFCSLWSKKEHQSDTLPLKYGFFIIGVFMVSVKYTGASMNPFRSFIPVLFSPSSNKFINHWVYWASPILAAVLCPLIYLSYNVCLNFRQIFTCESG